MNGWRFLPLASDRNGAGRRGSVMTGTEFPLHDAPFSPFFPPEAGTFLGIFCHAVKIFRIFEKTLNF